MGGQGLQRLGKAAVEHRRVDAAGQVAQLADGCLGVRVGGVDEFAGVAARSGASPRSRSRIIVRSIASATSRACAPSCRLNRQAVPYATSVALRRTHAQRIFGKPAYYGHWHIWAVKPEIVPCEVSPCCDLCHGAG